MYKWVSITLRLKKWHDGEEHTFYPKTKEEHQSMIFSTIDFTNMMVNGIRPHDISYSLEGMKELGMVLYLPIMAVKHFLMGVVAQGMQLSSNE